MSGLTRMASHLACGALCWLAAGSALAGWTMDSPGGFYTSTFHKNDEVPGTGDAPAANVDYLFQITEHGSFQSVIATSGVQTTEAAWWDSTLNPPDEGTWPLGYASAVVRAADGTMGTYQTIEFVN